MEKRRLQFDFTEEAVEELDELQQLTHLPTRVEAIRHALRFLRWAVDETRNGGMLCIERDGKIREVIPFWKSVVGSSPVVRPSAKIAVGSPNGN
jgi:hypothetical protein